MAEVAIQVEGLGKAYSVGHRREDRESYTALRDVVARNLANIARRTRDLFAGRPIVPGDEVEEFWALKDISFKVERGERVGVIGRNGAGKSTLLKVLSRITEPTAGRVTINGRVASLLEVGTGFHAELTGRENIFVNGAILGMSRQDVLRKFDEIVAFAGVEKFLDTPVKRYSSGMYLRLAFSVAAHLEPEILIVDEVLAVGDFEFQRKCLGKMRQVSREGRTVLFVSHNMEAVSELCDRAILISDGEMEMDGPTGEVIDRYFLQTQSSVETTVFTSSCGRFKLRKPRWIDGRNNTVSGYRYGDDYTLRFEFHFDEHVPRINPGFRVKDQFGKTVFISHLADDDAFSFDFDLDGKITIDTMINLPTLAPGHYEIDFGVRDENETTVIYAENALHLEIAPRGPRKNGAGGLLWHTSRWVCSAADQSRLDVGRMAPHAG